MKKKSLVFLSCCMLTLGLMTGCGQNSTSQDSDSEITQTEATQENNVTEEQDSEEEVEEQLSPEEMEEAEGIFSMKKLSIDAVVTFGNYEQDNNESNGLEPIAWVYADNYDGYAVLVSYYGLDEQPYNTEQTEITWENCSLRKWLNEDFYNIAFNDEEKEMMSPINLQNPGNSKHNIEGGNDTLDSVWMLCDLDIERIKNYSMTKAYKLLVEEADGEIETTAYVQSKEKPNPYAREGSEPETYKKIEAYWLRMPGNDLSKAAVGWDDSNFGEISSDVSLNHVVRPVIVLKEDAKVKVISGNPNDKYIPDDKDKKTAPKIGMTAEEVRNSTWGKPESINTTETASHISEQWVYSNNRYVYLEDGIVTTIQDSK